jgi:hypothetical protein
MPKNLRGGKHKHLKNHIIGNEDDLPMDFSNSILKADENNPDWTYGIITKNYGAALEVTYANGKTCRVLFPKTFKRKGIFLNKDDLVLFEMNKLGNFVICKYDPNEKEYLKSIGAFTFMENINSSDNADPDTNNDTGFNFDDI